MISALTASSQINAGHRDAAGNPVMDVTQADILPLVNQSFSEFSNVTIENLELSDDPAVPDYIPSLFITVSYQKPSEPDQTYAVTFQYILTYDPVTNNYIDSDQDGIVNGGRKYCFKRNCVGCKEIRDEKGRLTGCTTCIPVTNGNGPNTSSYECYPVTVGGNNAAEIIGAITSLIGAIGLLLN